MSVLARCRLAAVLLPMLASCAAQPLSQSDFVLVARPMVSAGDDSLSARAEELVARSVRREISVKTRLSPANEASDLSSGCAVLHLRVEQFEPARPGRSGSARSEMLATDFSGKPIARGRALTIAGFVEDGDQAGALAAGIGADSARFLGTLSGPGPSVRDSVAADAAAVAQFDARWQPAKDSNAGRAGIRAALFMSSAGNAKAGSGSGAPRFYDAFSPAPGAAAAAWWAPFPGLALEASAGKAVFAGRRFESGGLSVQFDDLEMLFLCAGGRLLLPLRTQWPRRWWSSWDPFEDTRGLNVVLRANAGFAGCGDVSARVVRDASGEIPTLPPGTALPYFRRGLAAALSAFAGLEARFGEESGPVFTASLCVGIAAFGPPPPVGAGSRSGHIAGLAMTMEIGAGF